ncbi:MAG: Eco57I restriction-modification methylase domain-containing protein [Microbacterium sp.]|uniref:Eco57I restriction-modification methylase domain-containing protein n=1 Tax=Microbacterium sp. TaxID=51671 RepID=UPI003D6FF6C8
MPMVEPMFDERARAEAGDLAIPDSLKAKIAAFEREREKFTSPGYKEYEVRADFLDHLLEALGWDVHNKRGAKYAQREVVRELSTQIDGASKAPDYALVLNGSRRAYVEAKKPSESIENSAKHALQIRRYCWSGDLPYGLLTDFDEYAIYDCRAIPGPDDSQMVGRVAYFTLAEIEDYWPVLVGTFGRDAVASGSLDRIAATVQPPSGTRPVDVQFLSQIRTWRANLAADVAQRNLDLDSNEISQAVQRLIDRVVFMRNVEARGLESPESLKLALTEPQGTYGRLLDLFHRADARYNAGLFAFTPDDVNESLDVSDGVLTSIINGLYFPEPYEFSAMPADILGRIYEQFLGEQIVVDADRNVTIELKPEYRKGGGVYYTPGPIVEYIVEETLGPLLEGKTEQAIANLTVVDPSSGSGSFLIVAYQYLLDWYANYWSRGPVLAKRHLEVGSDGQTRVKTNYRKQILLRHIYGVDIDPQAVEVTKLSLLLKVVEGQSQAELELGHLLPNLDNNIKCGNSLIAPDMQTFIDDGAADDDPINPFDWAEAFPAIFARGGFDAVVGNPPYLNIDATWGKKDPRLTYLKAHYASVYTDKTDLLFYFLRKAVDICRGEIGMIVSRSFMESAKAVKLRGWLAQNARVRSILDFRHAHVFPKVGINTAIVRLTSSKVKKDAVFQRFQANALPIGYGPDTLRDPELVAEVTVKPKDIGSNSWNFGDAGVQAVLRKIDEAGTPIGQILHVGKGMETGANKAFEFTGDEATKESLIKAGWLRQRARNGDIAAYRIRPTGPWMLYVEDATSFNKLPSAAQHLITSYEADLRKRAAFIRGNCDWWRYTWPLHRAHTYKPRILAPYRAQANRFALDTTRRFLGVTDTTILYDNDQPEDIKYFLGFLNSSILEARFKFIGKLLGAGVLEYYENTVSKLVVPRSKPGDPLHDSMVERVTSMIEATDDRASTQIKAEQDALDDQIAQLKTEIDALAIDAYGLGESEVELLLSQAEHWARGK